MTPIVTLSRGAWRDLLAMALGHAREGGGLLVGRWTQRANCQIKIVTGMTHVRADAGRVEYNQDERAKARKAAYSAYKPLEPVGEWHTHPHTQCCADALIPQCDEDDASMMMDNNIEIIVVTYPIPLWWESKGNDYLLKRVMDSTMCRAEAWIKIDGEAKACEIRVR